MTIYTASSRVRLLELLEPFPVARRYPELTGDGVPVDPRELLRVVDHFVGARADFATLSELALERVQHLIRHGRVASEAITLLHRGDDGVDRKIRLDFKGELIEPWPDDGLANIFEAGFYLRFAREFLDPDTPSPKETF